MTVDTVRRSGSSLSGEDEARSDCRTEVRDKESSFRNGGYHGHATQDCSKFAIMHNYYKNLTL